MNVVITVVILVVIGYFLINKGKLSFWKKVGKNPDAAYDYLVKHPDVWKIIYKGDDTTLDSREWTGPFRLYVPSIDKVIMIYGKIELYEKEQTRLLNDF